MIIKKKYLKKKSLSGFSLIEAIIVLGLTAGLALAGSKILKLMNQNKIRQEMQLQVNEELNLVKKYLIKVKHHVPWEDFLPTETYDSQGINVTWPNNNYKFAVNNPSSKDYYNSSNSIEFAFANSSNMMFSRCVAKNKYKNKETMLSAFNLPMVPMIKFIGSRIDIFCCNKAGILCTDKIINKDSTWRVKTFYMKKNSIIELPAKGNKRFIQGTGFFISFNTIDRPNLFTMTIFNQSVTCIKALKKNCTSRFKNKFMILNGTVLRKGLSDKGFIELR